MDVPAALEALLALGWARETAGEDSLVVPKGKFFSMAEACFFRRPHYYTGLMSSLQAGTRSIAVGTVQPCRVQTGFHMHACIQCTTLVLS